MRVSQFTTKGKDVSYEDVPVLMRDGAKVNIRLHIPPAVKARPVPVVYYRTWCLCVLCACMCCPTHCCPRMRP